MLIKISLLTIIYFNTSTSVIQSCGVTLREKIDVKMESFYITLPSNVKSFETSNKIGNYTTQLAKRYIFPNDEDWEVGIAEVSYGKNWYNLHTRQKVNLFSISADPSKQRITQIDNVTSYIEPGLYAKPKLLVKKINELITRKFGGTIKNLLRLYLNRFNQKISYTLGKDNGEIFFINFESGLSRILGLEEKGKTIYQTISTHGKFSKKLEEAYKSKVVNAIRPVDLYAGYHTLYVYSDIVDYSVIGNTYSQLLRSLEVPTNKDFGDQVVLTYPNPIYVPILKK